MVSALGQVWLLFVQSPELLPPGSWLPVPDGWLLPGQLELRGPDKMVEYT